MGVAIGVVCAFAAMLCWGVGDFLIQRSTRSLGDWETLFCIAFVGVIILAPFSLRSALAVTATNHAAFIVLSVASLVLFVGALLEFESLRRGKLSVVEPIWSSEIFSSVILAFFIFGEHLSRGQIFLIILLVAGLFLVSFRERKGLHRLLLEPSSLLALVAALIMGTANFFFGMAARVTDPLLINFFSSAVLMIGSLVYLGYKGKIGGMYRAIVSSPQKILAMTLLDNGAWIAFAFAMTLAPIGVAVALSESYIIIAVLLGLFINKEQLQRHQKLGLGIAVCAAVILAVVTL